MGFNSQGITAGDPKYWPKSIRYACLGNVCVFVFLGNLYAAGLSTGFVELAEEFHVSFNTLAELISWAVFALGVSNVFWMPTALCIGKRPVILISMAVFLAGTVWSVKASSFNSLLGSRIVATFGAGSVEALGPAIIADMFFERYYATAMALFALFLTAGSQVGPVISGFLIGAKGWRWFFIFCAILNAVNLVVTFFLLPETTYRRFPQEAQASADFSKDGTVVVDKIEEVATSDRLSCHDERSRAPYAGSYMKDLIHFRNRAAEDRGMRRWLLQFSLPFRFLMVPSVLFAAMAYGISLSGIVVISALGPELLSRPPYLFTPSKIGLYTLASFIGIIIAYPIAGPLTDLLSRYMSKRNGGAHMPEHRIPALIVPFLICPPGFAIFAYMIQQQRSYVFSAIGYAMQSSSLVFVPAVVLSYVVDTYPVTGGEALVLINAGKNLVAFGIVTVANDWMAKVGLVKMFWELAAAQWAVLALALPLFFWGPAMTKVTGRLIR